MLITTGSLSFRLAVPSASNGIIVAGGNGSGAALNQFNGPDGVFVDNLGNIYVADFTNGRVLKFPSGSDSSTLGTIVAGGNGIGDENNQVEPSAVFVDATGNIYVADYQSSRVLKFPPNSDSNTYGEVVAGGNYAGPDQNQFNGIDGVWVDSTGNIYAADFYNLRIIKFPPNGNAATQGVTIAANIQPGEVFVDNQGNVYSPDELTNAIIKFTYSGNLDTTFLSPNAAGYFFQL